MGLFTGMSILSMIEIAFWITRIVFHACPSQRKSNTENEGNIEASSGLGSIFDIIFNSNKETKSNLDKTEVEECPTQSM